ncbi:competence type IV pilus ATPase ComGA [Liquorilactobacillus cacaonum]|uniref:ComG operon protein 1 n=1 Tax=Liquorilactobacillus cacaonum DSM 21116 TaxID=1423729 RepID=A0A0R2CIZ9_9LACO|nr:competence type IV pilus ATPase ComGA [Liquorilactobacillus cacaonum]KRM91569.1 ComG operon protein 1 [Liquorilactobacillus cacaonum DSM 21116]
MNELIQNILDTAIKEFASDISLHPYKDTYEIKMTMKGESVVYQTVDFEKGKQIINNLKFRSSMSLSEQRRPQTGSLTVREGVYSRMASIGDFLGREILVIRLIYQRKNDLNEYFFADQMENILNKAQNKGLILFSGPVGSGKTTTMYQVARQLGNQVMTIEDPVEIYEPNFLQLQVNNLAHMDYATLIKATLRHRFDALIVGEIRDEETAKYTVKAALSGHLVLSTVHALNAVGVISRMKDFSVKDTDLRQTLKLVNYQRLIPMKNKGQSKVLFEQIDSNNLDQKQFVDRSMQLDWFTKLEECWRKGWITNDTFEKYKEG